MTDKLGDQQFPLVLAVKCKSNTGGIVRVRQIEGAEHRVCESETLLETCDSTGGSNLMEACHAGVL